MNDERILTLVKACHMAHGKHSFINYLVSLTQTPFRLCLPSATVNNLKTFLLSFFFYQKKDLIDNGQQRGRGLRRGRGSYRGRGQNSSRGRGRMHQTSKSHPSTSRNNCNTSKKFIPHTFSPLF